MTPRRRRALRSLLKAAWWGSALTTAFALIGLLVITGVPGAPRLALRADTYNQMTGVGSTASAVTVNWTSGLLDSTNQPITGSSSTDGGLELNPNAARAAGSSSSSPLWFMDTDFQKLQVTVSQTQNIGQQGITVSWTGAKPTGDGTTLQLNFLQMMECYGDSASGPSPENCLYGSNKSQGPTGTSGEPNPGAYLRSSYLCGTGGPGSVQPSTSNPPPGPFPSTVCDPFEPAAQTPTHCNPTAGLPSFDTCAGRGAYIPFVPLNDSSNPVYDQTTYEQQYKTTNEVPFAGTNSDGTGQLQFASYTANQAPELGCGALESNGQTRNCWLVIVPRGSFEPSGLNASSLTSGGVDSSPLSAGNWAQRIQVHLGYAPLAANCPPTVVPQAMIGTQVAYRAVSSWQQALNQQSNCAALYSYTAYPESTVTSQLTGVASGVTGDAGMAFTSVPIGSEATREGGGPAPALPNILYAPVAVTAIDFGFNINQSGGGTFPSGQITTPVNLSPALVAKSLTQVYQYDLPDRPLQTASTTWWANNNPTTIVRDPEFQKLNPEVFPSIPFQGSLAPLFTGDHSGDNQLIWDYVQSDPATASWLNGGAPNPSDPVAADPGYVALPHQLGSPPAADSYPVAYTGTLTCPQATTQQCPKTGVTTLNSVDLLAVQQNFQAAAFSVLAAVSPALTPRWDPNATAPDGSNGWWTSTGPEATGGVFMWAVNDMPDLAADGIISAALCDASGANCVQPSVASVSAALTLATTDSATGMVEVNPATVEAANASSKRAGAYPLVDVVYAAVPTNQPAAALTNYANFISYAANQGQTAGTAQGNLPAGYLPLTPALQAQANSVVTQLQADAAAASASPTTSTTPATTTGNTTAGSTTPAGGSTTPAGLGSNPGGLGSTVPVGVAAKPSGTTPAGKNTAPAANSKPTTPTTHPGATPTVSLDIIPPSAQAAAGTTPLDSLGGARGVLIIVLIVGAAGAVAGILFRYGTIPDRFRRRPPKPDTS